MVCTVTGTIHDLTGSTLPNQMIRFRRTFGVVSQDNVTVVPAADVDITSDASGNISVDLYPGTYRASTNGYNGTLEFAVGVPDAASAALKDIINQLPTITSTILSDAVAARDKAEQWAEEPEDSTVETSPDKYSALHWAAKAADSATSAANTAASLAGFDLEAIAETKAETAVDVFVYDTSKDSDGGAWRKRTQGTSWYNEPLNTSTRGSRREFPAVAVIVAEAGRPKSARRWARSGAEEAPVTTAVRPSSVSDMPTATGGVNKKTAEEPRVRRPVCRPLRSARGRWSASGSRRSPRKCAARGRYGTGARWAGFS